MAANLTAACSCDNGESQNKLREACPRPKLFRVPSSPFIEIESNEPKFRPRVYNVSVRQLVEFVLRRGDLSSGNRVPQRFRAWQGIQSHRKLQRSRPEGYEAEVPLTHEVPDSEFLMRISGRIDGVWKQENNLLLEEIKSVTRSWNHIADPLHWAQIKLYGFIYANQNALEKIDLQLSYFEIESEQLTVFREKFSRSQLEEFVAPIIAEYLDWLREQEKWRRLRDDSIRQLNFPYGKFRHGQRALSATVYKAVLNSRKVFAEAPTGIGKTMSVLFPAIKALPEKNYDRLFYLTAKTSTQAVAENAFVDLRKAGLHLRALTLSAREKVCVRNGKPCDVMECPFAKGYYDRLKPALREALQGKSLARAEVEQIATRHQLCPHEFSLDLSEWVDAIVCDYNYVFDPAAYLKRHFAEGSANNVFLIDEAHNLVERARIMFSAELDFHQLHEAQKDFRDEAPKCASTLRKSEKILQELFLETQDGNELMVLAELPRELLQALEKFITAAEAWFAQQAGAVNGKILESYFGVNSFLQTAELFGARYRLIVKRNSGNLNATLFCLDPSGLLEKTLQRASAAVFFSATLTPLPYFRTALGGSKEDEMVRLGSPFPKENLKVLIADGIKTSFRHRTSTFDSVCEAIREFVGARTGNYIAYFPSFAYLNEVFDRLKTHAPDLEIVAQTPNMTDAQRLDFLKRFEPNSEKTLLGLAAMGGVFGEGIDLVGERLVGAIIVGVGLPQLCLERNLIRAYFDEQGLDGFDYAYVFPGMNRVLQAVGRVIRSETDRGAVLLIDSRFSEERYRELFPAWWETKICDACFVENLKQFWLG